MVETNNIAEKKNVIDGGENQSRSQPQKDPFEYADVMRTATHTKGSAGLENSTENRSAALSSGFPNFGLNDLNSERNDRTAFSATKSTPEALNNRLTGGAINRLIDHSETQVTSQRGESGQRFENALTKAIDEVYNAVQKLEPELQTQFKGLYNSPEDGSFTKEQLQLLKNYSKTGFAAAQNYNAILHHRRSSMFQKHH